jgi:hypothetical protein
MSDELDVLRHDRDVVEPDPHFRAVLMDRLRQDLASPRGLVLAELPPSTERVRSSQEEMRLPPGGEPPRRSVRRLVALAAAVVLIAAAAVAVIRDRDPGSDLAPVSPGKDEVTTDSTVDPAKLFADVAPGSTVELPPAPISERALPSVVWSGREVIVWGGMGADGATLDDGAAFDPVTGGWRVIAPAPVVPRLSAGSVWTGTEMLIWGGSSAWSGGQSLKDGAAYDPEADTWRRLADGPFDTWDYGAGSIWTGEELVVIGLEPTPPAGERKPMAAYDPAVDEWRQLADLPEGTDFDLAWTGEALLTTVTGYSRTTGEGTSTEVWSYDPDRDRWDSTAVLESADVGLVPVFDTSGEVRAVIAEGHEAGTRLTVLDRTGRATGTLPAIPVDAASFGDMTWSLALWLGEEGVFSTRPVGSEETPAYWALSWSTETWRPLDADEAPPIYFDLEPVPGAGVLIGFSGIGSEDGGVSHGVVYRPPGPGAG